jgi:hypothetical protein
MKILARIQRLEETLVPLDGLEERVIEVQFVNSQREVVSSFTVKLAPSVRTRNGGRGAQPIAGGLGTEIAEERDKHET